jgi:hypothetical protein
MARRSKDSQRLSNYRWYSVKYYSQLVRVHITAFLTEALLTQYRLIYYFIRKEIKRLRESSERGETEEEEPLSYSAI